MRPFGKALREALASYENGLKRIVAAGRITQEDAKVIARVGTQLGLTEKDTLPYRLKASQSLFEYEVRHQRWRDHDGALDSLPRLGLNGTTDPTLVTAYHVNRVARLQHRFEVTGRAEPLVSQEGALIPEHGETEVLMLAASLYEERVTGTLSFGMSSHRFTGDDGGVNEHGSSLTSTSVQRDVVPVSKGHIHLTDRRFVFTGTTTSSDLHWRELNAVDSAGGVLSLYVERRAHTLILRPYRPEYCHYARCLMLHYAQAAQRSE